MANFQQNILNDLENGDGADMPSPFAAGGQAARIPELADGDNGYKPEIRVITLMENGQYTYDTEVTLMEQALTGPGKAFEGCQVTRTGKGFSLCCSADSILFAHMGLCSLKQKRPSHQLYITTVFSAFNFADPY